MGLPRCFSKLFSCGYCEKKEALKTIKESQASFNKLTADQKKCIDSINNLNKLLITLESKYKEKLNSISLNDPKVETEDSSAIIERYIQDKLETEHSLNKAKDLLNTIEKRQKKLQARINGAKKIISANQETPSEEKKPQPQENQLVSPTLLNRTIFQP
jgi:hypothetical protein